MHELSVAESLVDLVSEALLGEEAARVVSVRLRLGPLSGVVPRALQFAWDAATSGTRLDGAALRIDEVTAAAFCPRCGREHDLPDVAHLRCPVCGDPTPDVVRGRELEVSTVEVVDAPAFGPTCARPDEAQGGPPSSPGAPGEGGRGRSSGRF